MNQNDGGQAFPRQLKQVSEPDCYDYEDLFAQNGMSLRDYYAGEALKGILAHAYEHEFEGEEAGMGASYHVFDAWGYADAMLKERDKNEQS